MVPNELHVCTLRILDETCMLVVMSICWRCCSSKLFDECQQRVQTKWFATIIDYHVYRRENLVKVRHASPAGKRTLRFSDDENWHFMVKKRPLTSVEIKCPYLT